MDREESRYAIGVRITREELIGVLVNLDGNIVPVRSGAAQPDLTRKLEGTRPATVVHGIATLTEELLSVRSDLRRRVVGLGVSVGGHVHGDIGEVHLCPNLGWKTTVPLHRLLTGATGLTSVIENDVKALAVAEQLFGSGSEHETFAVVKIGAGVGCGFVLNHELYTGATGLAGELGHFPVEPGGVGCACGKTGCLQTIASRDAMLELARATGLGVATIDELTSLARVGDSGARAAIERAGEMLGRGLAMLLNLLNLPAVLLHAEQSLLDTDAYMQSVRKSLERHAFSSAATDCRILPRPLTDILEARGAASMAFRDLAG